MDRETGLTQAELHASSFPARPLFPGIILRINSDYENRGLSRFGARAVQLLAYGYTLGQIDVALNQLKGYAAEEVQAVRTKLHIDDPNYERPPSMELITQLCRLKILQVHRVDEVKPDDEIGYVHRLFVNVMQNVLSLREAQVLGNMAKGLTTDEIAEVEGIEPETIRKHKWHIYAKLRAIDPDLDRSYQQMLPEIARASDVITGAQAIVSALRQNILVVDEPESIDVALPTQLDVNKDGAEAWNLTETEQLVIEYIGWGLSKGEMDFKKNTLTTHLVHIYRKMLLDPVGVDGPLKIIVAALRYGILTPERSEIDNRNINLKEPVSE